MSAESELDNDDYLDWFLSSAFESVPGGSDESVETVIPKDSTEESSVPEYLGRYPVSERIGQGGIGIVYRVSDPELGRDLAIKVIRRSLADDPEILDRFIEEGRICSRLQHPGVVPVHEVGRLEDGRPYFTMKIVDGQTLGRLLRDRGQPGLDVRRFLKIFESVCETLAFAHSHGVTHSDLTPRNIMVGVFGEVQVMDWGFAIAGQSGSEVVGGDVSATVEPRVARIIGTPAYLSPEQASGRRDRVGPGTDVFGLGGILCEILTGAPPYLGETKADLLLRASRGWLDDARARLEACGADPVLAALCLRCLEPDIVNRPETADVVLREVREYLFSLEERARTLELKAAKAVAVASQERRNRQLALALGVVALAAVTIPGAIYLQNFASQSRRRASTDSAIERSMTRAKLLLADERLARANDPGAYSEAMREAREAEVLARTADARPESLAQTQDLIEAIRVERDRVLLDRKISAELSELRLHYGGVRRAASDEATWAFTGSGSSNGWTELAPTRSPSARMDHAMAPYGDGRVLLFGGAPTKYGPLLRDTWSWDGGGWTPLSPAHTPPVRTGHVMSHDRVRGRVVMFGGASAPLGEVRYHRDTWEWDGEDWQLIAPEESPPRRDWSAMAFDPISGSTLLFGGRDSSHQPNGRYEPYGDTWSWDGESWTELFPTNSPSPRHGHRLAYDSNLGQLILTGGQYPGKPGYGDTWAWDGSEWSRLLTDQVYPGRAFGAMAFDAARSVMVLYGGKDVENNRLFGDTWEFDGSDWALRSEHGPAYGWSPIVFDRVRGQILVQGGATSPTRSESIEDQFRSAFAEYGIDVDEMDAMEAAERIRSCSIRSELLYALDEWMLVVRGSGRRNERRWRTLIQIADLADADEWRRTVREAFSVGDVPRLHELATAIVDSAGFRSEASPSDSVTAASGGAGVNPYAETENDLSAPSLDLLASCLLMFGDRDTAIRVFRLSGLLHPGDFNAHLKLASILDATEPTATDEILRLMHMAVAVWPDNPRALTILGHRLALKGDHAEASAILERAVRVEPGLAVAWRGLGESRRMLGQFDQARVAFESAILQGEGLAETDLAAVLREVGRFEEAIQSARRATENFPGRSICFVALGAALMDTGEFQEALAAFDQALRVDSRMLPAHYLRGRALLAMGRFEDAVVPLRDSVELSKNAPEEQAVACRAWFDHAAALVAQLSSVGNDRVDEVSSEAGLLLAEAVAWRGDPIIAARLFEIAFAADPARSVGRIGFPGWSAVITVASVALAETTGHIELSSRWRDKLLEWMREDLTGLRNGMLAGDVEVRVAASILTRWSVNRSLAGLRDQESTFSSEERTAWQSLWDDIESLRDQIARERP